jgi:hypothetical protein
MVLPSASECLLNPVICSSSGSAVADSNKTIAEADGTDCSSPSGGRRVCNKPICSGGSCVNVADPALKDQKCGESQDEGCITKTPLCNSQGECVAGAGRELKAGAQCAPPGQLPTGLVIAKPEYLPASFMRLFTDGGAQPEYSCGDDCKLLYCGDGIRNRSEDCDGSDLPPNAPTGSSCLSTCTLQGGPVCEPQPDRPIVCRIDVATDSGVEERETFSLERCGYNKTARSIARPNPSCSERVPGQEAVRSRATAFVLTDDKKGCRWVVEESTVVAPPIQCALDPNTGSGLERRPVLSVKPCEYALESKEIKKPDTTCSEVEQGKSATVSTPALFVKVNEACAWTQEAKTITAPPRSCRFDVASGKAYEDRSVLSPSCEYVAQSQEIPKPAPECIDTGLNDLKFTQATTFNPKSSICAWDTDFVRIKKPSQEGCSVTGSTGTQTTITLVSDMQASPPVCRWDETKVVTTTPRTTCDYREGIPYPSWEERMGMTPEERADLVNTVGKLTYTTYSLEPVGCTVVESVDERYQPEITTCETDTVMTTWVAHDSLLPFRSGKVVGACTWVAQQQACRGFPIPPPLRGGIGRTGGSAPAPSQPNPPAPQPPPPAKPAQCNFYTISAAAYITTPQGLHYSSGNQTSCIANRLGWAQRSCGQSNPLGSGPEYLDDCIASKIAPMGSVMLNAQCQEITSQPQGAILCSSAVYGYRASPISLIWAAPDASSDIWFSKFPLFAEKTKRVVVWKASDSMPLLVHDPEHTGIISSPEQLFGDNFQGGNKGKPWRDGYDALGSLDANADGEVSGDELKPLALWFDTNRDGVSQSGEVRPLNHPEVDVRKLFYKGALKNEKSSDINLALGFERMRNGKVERAPSVDWYAEGAESKDALLNKLTAMSRIESSGSPLVQNGQNGKDVYARVKSPLNGAFVWRSKDDLFKSYAKDAPGGAMSFTEYAGGKISGHLYVETDYAAGGPLKSQMDAVFVHGTVETLPDGSKKINFRPLGGSLSGTEFTSTAILSKEGSTLSGDTSVVFNYNGDVRRFTYSWTAQPQ